MKTKKHIRGGEKANEVPGVYNRDTQENRETGSLLLRAVMVVVAPPRTSTAETKKWEMRVSVSKTDFERVRGEEP